MTQQDGLRERILSLLSSSVDRPIDALLNGQSFQEMGVDSVAVVDALFTLEEHLGVTLGFDATGGEDLDMDGSVAQMVDQIVELVSASPNQRPG
jgi:acyl carrier protein